MKKVDASTLTFDALVTTLVDAVEPVLVRNGMIGWHGTIDGIPSLSALLEEHGSVRVKVKSTNASSRKPSVELSLASFAANVRGHRVSPEDYVYSTVDYT